MINLREVLAGKDKKYEWLNILREIQQLSESPDRDLLEQLSKFHGIIDLTHGYDGPHSKAPDEMIRFVTKQILAKLDGHHYFIWNGKKIPLKSTKQFDARGTEGFLLTYPDPTTKKDIIVFRIYEKDENGKVTFRDYNILHQDLKIKLLDGHFYETDKGNFLDY